MNILSNRIKLVILGKVSSRFGEIRCRYVSSYFEKILACNTVFCFKCQNEVCIGDQYETVASKNTGSKYYHSDCYESLYI